VAVLLFLPVVIGLLMLQMSVISNLPLISGNADIILLAMIAWGIKDRGKYFWLWPLIAGMLVSLVSAAPFWVYVLSYLVVAILARVLVMRLWQMPVLLMLFLTIMGTFFQHMLFIVSVQLSGASFSWATAFSQISMPSALLNIFLSLPVYILISDFADFVRPSEAEL
jgi:hypothetical protein